MQLKAITYTRGGSEVRMIPSASSQCELRNRDTSDLATWHRVMLITIARAITPVTNVRNRTILIVTQYRQLNEMTVEQLWDLHQEVAAQLTRKVTLEKAKWEERLRRVSSVSHLVSEDVKRERRPYPKVPAKYRNPKNPEETWAGRGKQPRWLAAQLRSGKQLDQFLIRRSS